MFDNYIVPVFFGGGALALLGLLLFGWALPSFLKGKWSYLISLLGLGLVAFAYFDGTIVITYKIWLGLLGVIIIVFNIFGILGNLLNPGVILMNAFSIVFAGILCLYEMQMKKLGQKLRRLYGFLYTYIGRSLYLVL